MAWKIKYSNTAKKQLRKLDKNTARRIIDFMDARVLEQDDPRALGKDLKGELGDLWRYRVGNIRIICDIQDNVLTILVVKMGHRKDVYQ